MLTRKITFTALACAAVLAGAAGREARAGNDRPPSTPAPCSSTSTPEYAAFAQARDELRRLAQRNAYSGVETQFQIMLDNMHAGTACVIDKGDYVSGAVAALMLGEPGRARARYLAAGAAGDVANIDRNFGSVAIDKQKKVNGKYPPLSRAVTDPALDAITLPGGAEALASARQKLDVNGAFVGYLPNGHYALDFTGKTFTVAGNTTGQVHVP